MPTSADLLEIGISQQLVLITNAKNSTNSRPKFDTAEHRGLESYLQKQIGGFDE
jgi:hypothetical protein